MENTVSGEIYTGPLTVQFSRVIWSRFCVCGHSPGPGDLVRIVSPENSQTAIVRCRSCGLDRKPPKVHGRLAAD